MDSALAAMTGDFGKATREIVAAMPRSGGPSLRDSGELASDQLHLHEVTAARETEAQIAPRAGAGEFDIETVAAAKAIFEAAAAAEIEDWPALWNAYVGIDPNKLGGRGREEITTQVVPFAALARARMGDIAGGQALIAKTPLDCYLCLRTRGQIEALAHDRSGADRWFAEAVRQGPALPFAYMDSGQVLLAKNDADGAVAKLKEAHKLSPRYADPLEAWGEALMAKRDYAKAIKKFAEADKDAPKWGRNHLRWGEALMLSGRYAEARAQYQTASGLDLSAGDRAALNLLLARTATGLLHG
jgi:tetratricopeptide (TPR) repeat protein